MRNAVLTVAVLVSLAACGGGGSSGPASPGGTVIDPGPPPASPVITSVEMPATVEAGAVVTFSAAVVHAGAISYQWTQQCAGPEGTFGTPSAPVTTWKAPDSGAHCDVLVAATAAGLTAEAGGFVEVIVPAALVTQVWVLFSDLSTCELFADADVRACVREYVADPGAQVYVVYGVDVTPLSVSLLADCGEGLLSEASSADGVFDWSYPGGTCRLAARVDDEGVFDVFQFTLADDDFPLDDDEPSLARFVGDAQPFGEFTFDSYACDQDHYAFSVATGVAALDIHVYPALHLRLLDDAGALVGEAADGVLIVTVPPLGAPPYYVLNVVPPVERPSGLCGPEYQVVVAARP